MTTTDVRLATPADLDALVAVDRDAYGGDALVRGRWRRPLTADGYYPLVLSVDGTDAAFLVARDDGDARGRFLDVRRCGVREKFRGLGLCRDLLGHLGTGRLRLRLRLHRTDGLAAAVHLGFVRPRLLPNYFGDDDAVELWRPATEG